MSHKHSGYQFGINGFPMTIRALHNHMKLKGRILTEEGLRLRLKEGERDYKTLMLSEKEWREYRAGRRENKISTDVGVSAAVDPNIAH